MLVKFTFFSFLLFVFSLGFMQPFFLFYGQKIPISDFIFTVTFLLFIIALIFKKIEFRRHGLYPLLLFYFAAMFLSACFSENVRSSFFKLLGEIYLLTLPVLTFNLVRDPDNLKKVFYAWLSATVVCVLIGFLTIFLFYFDRENRLLRHTLFYYGTLPPGNYPRISSTFINGNMLCNYLSVGLMMLLISGKCGWINKKLFYLSLVGILFCAFFTISPGLGGISLALGLWFWILLKNKTKLISKACLLVGISCASLFLFVAVIAPSPHKTAEFLVNLPVIDKQIAPSARTMTWIDSFHTFAENPFFGKGLGQNACNVNYFDLSGTMQVLNDAHNTPLNVAAESGIFGLSGILVIVFYLTKSKVLFDFADNHTDTIKAGLVIAFISAFVYQGISGSFEDARHLWVLIGLIISADGFAKGGRAQVSDT